MSRPKVESMPQRELLHRLRYAIDTAVAYPTPENIEKAITLAQAHPQGMRSSHVSHNLGAKRWEWLGQHNVTFVGESVEIAGNQAIKATITPEVQK